MTTNTMRERFEAWLRSIWTDGYACPKNNDGSYKDPAAQRFWQCWNAALLSAHSVPMAEGKEAEPSDQRMPGEDVMAWANRVSCKKYGEEMDAIRKALNLEEDCDYGEIIEAIEALQEDASPAQAEQQVSFPERDASKTNAEQGLYRKFEVRRVDGSDAPGGKHHDCEYFVLDMMHDRYAKAALRTYAQLCHATHPQLAYELDKRYDLMHAQAEQHRALSEEQRESVRYAADSGEAGEITALDQLRKFVDAKRFDREVFPDQMSFGDWVVSRSRAVLSAHNRGKNE